MPGNNRTLKKDSAGIYAPQYFDKTKDDWDYAGGENGGSNVNPVGSSQLLHGVVDVPTAGTAVQLPNVPCREITIVAKDANTGPVFVGGAGVSNADFGYKLRAESSATLLVNNANLIYINADVSGEGVSFVAI